jgi:hypothetical protein
MSQKLVLTVNMVDVCNLVFCAKTNMYCFVLLAVVFAVIFV